MRRKLSALVSPASLPPAPWLALLPIALRHSHGIAAACQQHSGWRELGCKPLASMALSMTLRGQDCTLLISLL